MRSTLLAAVVSLVPLAVPAVSDAAQPAHAVVDGSARFEVLSPTLIRVEYAADGHFEDGPTFNAVDRRHSAPYRTWTDQGVRVVQTSALTLRYRENSGPFTPVNLSLDLNAGGKPVTAHPSWPGTCTFGTGCEAESLALSGGAEIASDHRGYTGNGFVAGFWNHGARIGWRTAVPADGDYAVSFRYANSLGGDNQNTTRTMSVVTGADSHQVTLPPTGSWDTWGVSTTTVHLSAGDNPIAIACGATDSCNVNVDSVAVTPAGAAFPTPAQTTSISGYRRSLDGHSGPDSMSDGLLNRDGWRLLDDTATVLRDPDGTVTQRPAHDGAYQDGYLFGYGHDYKQGLRDLHDLTGPAVLLPRWAYGVWYSRYYPYTEADYRTSLIPAFRAHQTPVDGLVSDTDWKSPNQWDGWEWNPKLFPDPTDFLAWARQQGLHVTLNVHPSISDADPQYPATVATAGKPLTTGSCYSLPSCQYFDFGDPAQLKAYFDLHKPVEQAGDVQWWLDQSNGESTTSTPNITQDSWINSRYAAEGDARGKRGFSLARIGGYSADYGGFQVPPTGAWAEHRSSVAFTGDTGPSWAMLSFEDTFTIREGAGIGLPAISHDIGGFYPDSANARGGHDDEDLYARWVQFGAFQPILRLHSDHGDRLPWNYGPAAEASAEKFLRLRESLLPYTYSLARQATDTGVPIVRALYLNYPEFDESYSHDHEYLYGDDVLVAPVTTPGTANVPTPVWIPPGTWTDYFTGKSYTGPATVTVNTGLDTMPVFLRDGGILTQRTQYANHDGAPLDQVTVDTSPGCGAFSLYEDSGEGHDYTGGASARTPITMSGHRLTIGAQQGGFPGKVTTRTWTVRVHNADAPTAVTLNGRPTRDWAYDPATRTLAVRTGARPTGTPLTVTYS